MSRWMAGWVGAWASVGLAMMTRFLGLEGIAGLSLALGEWRVGAVRVARSWGATAARSWGATLA
jgi:hypothetical protein